MISGEIQPFYLKDIKYESPKPFNYRILTNSQINNNYYNGGYRNNKL